MSAPNTTPPRENHPVIHYLVEYIFKKIQYGKLEIRWPDGDVSVFSGCQKPECEGVLVVNDWKFFKKVLRGGALGFAESYLADEWTTPDLPRLLEVLSLNKNEFEKHIGKSKILKHIVRLRHVLRPNTRAGSKKNIHAHYDLGNAFYEKWLDPSMTYSSAKFQSKKNSLEAAQLQKYQSLAEAIDLKENHHVLEIGCGWGGFAEYAASTIGCRVTGLTISEAQHQYARARIREKGLSDKVDIVLKDYRDVQGSFDRIASIEMFEAVGEKYWPAFFGKLAESLKPGGRAGLQIITIRNDKFKAYRKNVDFIQKYIFPGGMLPSKQILKRELDKAQLKLQQTIDFPLDYAETLSRWKSKFNDQWHNIQPLGFDGRFKRMWEYYLAYCEAGFRTGVIDVSQFSISKN